MAEAIVSPRTPKEPCIICTDLWWCISESEHCALFACPAPAAASAFSSVRSGNPDDRKFWCVVAMLPVARLRWTLVIVVSITIVSHCHYQRHVSFIPRHGETPVENRNFF